MEKFLKLKGKTAVFIDWANVYGWKKSLKRVVDDKKLYKYLRSYKDIENINFYFGTDKNDKSKNFLNKVKKTGYKLITKPVKYICVGQIDKQKIYKRKCDFDVEMTIDVHQGINKDFRSFIFFCGDGDIAPVYEMLIKQNKQVIVVYASGHIGKEVWNIKKGIFKVQVQQLGL